MADKSSTKNSTKHFTPLPGPLSGPLIDSCLICRQWLWLPAFLCGKCRAAIKAQPLIHRHDRGLDVFSLCHYVSPIDQFIRMGKGARLPRLTVQLAETLAEKMLLEMLSTAEVIVPMPAKNRAAHKDHAFLIAEAASRILRAPLCLNLLERADGKTEQKEKNIHERGKRILKVGSQRLEDLGGGAHRGIVVLVDDVITSGATLFQAWNILGRPPAIGLTVASTPRWSRTVSSFLQ